DRFICGVRVQRPPQPISNQHLCSLALFAFKDQACGQRLIRSFIRLKILTISSLTDQ
ncbi:unnamed protein product, partial [Hymenolepis diminuta]